MRLIALNIYKWQDRKSLSVSTQIDLTSFVSSKRVMYKELITMFLAHFDEKKRLLFFNVH